jgi:hypothetical protein
MAARFLAVLALALAVAPFGAAAPLLCGADCTVQSQSVLGFVPVVQPVPDGGRVTWGALDTAHVVVDNFPDSAAEPCFSVTTGPDPSPEDTLTVQFDIVGGALQATTDPGTSRAATLPCGSAFALAVGGFMLPYYCQIHPWMRAALLVGVV